MKAVVLSEWAFLPSRVFPWLLAPMVLAACGTSQRVQFRPEEIIADLSTRVPEDVAQKVVVPYDINDEIRTLAWKSVQNLRTDTERTRAIVNAIISRTGMSISYDWLSNKTAQQVFYEGKGNCLAYTNLFIGMAREVGVDAVYVDVTTVETISKEAEVIVNNGHITAGVRHGPDLTMIDFTRTPEREYVGAKVIDDFEAIANYYNNQGFLYGYYAETAGDMGDNFNPEEAELEMYQMSLEVDPGFPRARNNLGVALRRRGRVDEAIEQYKLALETDPKFAEARSNLGAAYYAMGHVDDAIREFERAAKTGGSNAYYYHHLGIIQFQQGNYEEAIRYFKKAVSRDSKLADSRYYLGETYLKLGDRQKAIEAYEKTLEVDPNYLSARAKLDLLVAEARKETS
ncbi:MAG TPA: tetratricopeptide repeat protein [Vicinamibacteria bacterium]|nr:tetratricopeptide repeat protein [Vicinamibacteria bacterium]